MLAKKTNKQSKVGPKSAVASAAPSKKKRGRSPQPPHRNKKEEEDDEAKSAPSSSVPRAENVRKRSRDDGDGKNDASRPAGEAQQQWSKSKKKRMRLLKAKQQAKRAEEQPKVVVPPPSATTTIKQGGVANEQSTTHGASENSRNPKQQSPSSSSSLLQRSFQERLAGSRFRALNEELYTSTSQSAYRRFRAQPELWDEYHAGFRRQVERHWPVNPVQVLVEKLRRQQERQDGKKLVVADFGCGDAELARQLLQSNSSDDDDDDDDDVNNNDSSKSLFAVHSFDLVARGPNAALVTACDCAEKTPLPAGSVDAGVFCLSLMGTNLADFVREAHRVLRADGRLHIAEVRSRFESNSSNSNNNNNNGNGKAGSSNGANKKSHSKDRKQRRRDDDKEKDPLQAFIDTLEKLGFRCVDMDRSNKMFVLLELRKNGKKPNRDLSFTAKPCIYKRR